MSTPTDGRTALPEAWMREVDLSLSLSHPICCSPATSATSINSRCPTAAYGC